MLRKKALPAAVVALAAVVVVASLNIGVRTGSESFAFRVYWPAPTKYVPSNPQPIVLLQINYTGAGAKDFAYVIAVGSSVIASGTASVTARCPFTVYAFSSTPASLQAEVTEQGKVVYRQSLELGR